MVTMNAIYTWTNYMLWNGGTMKVNDLIQTNEFRVLNQGDNLEKQVEVPYCCDLLSFAMGKMPENAAWVTVMGNVNTLAVAALTEVACIILAEGSNLDNQALAKAKEQGITVLATEQPIFETSLSIYRRIHA